MKFFALLLLSLIPCLIGFWKGEETREKMKMRKAFLSFLEEILFQIRHFNRDQKEIFFSFENIVLEKSGFLTDLRNETDENPMGSLHRTVQFHLPSFSFSKRAQESILLFTRHFGIQSRERQLEELHDTFDILQKELDQEKTQTENKIKIMRISGIATGLGFLILVI